jgi:hypothetical protein
MWDRQIEADLAAGKLNHLIARAEADIAANTVRDLNKVLDVAKEMRIFHQTMSSSKFRQF